MGRRQDTHDLIKSHIVVILNSIDIFIISLITNESQQFETHMLFREMDMLEA
jgi:hypothetical protein